MHARTLRLCLHDASAGYDASPARVRLAVLRAFVQDAHEFLRGDDRSDADVAGLEVALQPGPPLTLVTLPTAHPGLLRDVAQLAVSQRTDRLDARRRAVVARWQKMAHAGRGVAVEIVADGAGARPVVIDAESDFRADDADQWVRVERYLPGEIYEIGGFRHVNLHLRLADGRSLVIQADREMLRADRTNRLYKPELVRVRAEWNLVTREYRDAWLVGFVERGEAGTRAAVVEDSVLDRLAARGAAAWRGAGDAGAWVERMRGSTPEEAA